MEACIVVLERQNRELKADRTGDCLEDKMIATLESKATV
jgi:hypothetical protein